MIRTAVGAVLALVFVSNTPLTAQNLPSAAQDNWRRGGVCYEVFIRSYDDSDGDGIGDLPGLTRRLDYIKNLGANCIWVTPVTQSPSYHGYDITNYYQIKKDYGTNEDFKTFVAEAHKRGIHVLFDLVLNHTSSEHPYFRSAIVDSASAYRDWYLWSPVQRKLKTWNAPVWHPAGTRPEFYYGLFWSGMPDLNLKSAAVTAEAENIARFWLKEMGVDGFRFDAVQHFFEIGDTVRNAPPIHEWLRDYQAALRRIKPDVWTVGEVWETVADQKPYYPDQLDSYFTFEVSDALINAVQSGDGTHLAQLVTQAQQSFPALRWSPFLRNHDETRTLTDLGGDVAKNKTAATLLLTLPGYPFVYYGEEIGMTGLKTYGDMRIRTPMQWTKTKAAGFTTGTPWEPLQPDSFTANVQAQDGDANSLLNLYRKLIHLRAEHDALGGGDFVALNSPAGTIAYLRRSDKETALVIANLRDTPVKPLVSSAPSVLKPGKFAAQDVLADIPVAGLKVSGKGQIKSYIPVSSLAPRQSLILLFRR